MDRSPSDSADTERLGRRLQWATIAWNSIEVFVTIGLGIAARSLALVAFGLDSLVEVFASLVVIWHLGAGSGPEGDSAGRPARDRRALRLVAAAFALLAVTLGVSGVRSLLNGSESDSSPLGIAYLAATALVMFSLARVKHTVGTALGSEPFLAEAAMTRLDGLLASGVLVALALNAGLDWWWADPLAALVVAGAAAVEALDSWHEAAAAEGAAGEGRGHGA